MIQTIDFSVKQLITEIAITNSKTVHPLPHIDSKLYNVPSYLFRVSCWLYDASTGWLSHSECQHSVRSRIDSFLQWS